MYSSCTNTEGKVVELKTKEERENKSEGCVEIPELFLSIKGPDGQEVYNKDIKGLTKVSLNEENDSYDITETQGLIPIIKDYEIQVTGTENNPTVHEWEIRVTLKNLDSDQELNTGKRFNGKVIIQREEKTISTECKGENLSTCLAYNYRLDNNINYHNGSFRLPYINIDTESSYIPPSYYYILTDQYKDDYDSLYAINYNSLEKRNLIKQKCYVSDTPPENYCYGNNGYFYLATDESIHYNTFNAALKAAIEKGMVAVNGTASLDANDNSYRYSGGNYSLDLNKIINNEFIYYSRDEYVYWYKDDPLSSVIEKFFKIRNKYYFYEDELSFEEYNFFSTYVSTIYSDDISLFYSKNDAIDDAILNSKSNDEEFNNLFNNAVIKVKYFYYKDSPNKENIEKYLEISNRSYALDEDISSEDTEFLNNFEQQWQDMDIYSYITDLENTINEGFYNQIISDNFDVSEQYCSNSYGTECYEIYWYKDDVNADIITKYADLQHRYYDLSEELSTEDEEFIYDFEARTDLTYFWNKKLAIQDAMSKDFINTEYVKKLNNYVCVGNDCSLDKLYRIIGIFKNEVGEYEVKLIKAISANTTHLGSENAYNLDYDGYLWNTTNGITSSYSDKENTNMWQQSNLNIFNLNDYYYNTYLTTSIPDLKNMIVDHKWIVGGLSSEYIEEDSINIKEIYENELGKNRVKIGDHACNSVLADKTDCTEGDLVYNNKIGLMYVSDYMYGADNKYWDYPNFILSYDIYQYGDYRDTVGEDWLLGDYEWTITRDSSYKAQAMSIYPNGYFNYDGVDDSANASGVRPTFYISSRVILSSGDGTRANPYKLVLN